MNNQYEYKDSKKKRGFIIGAIILIIVIIIILLLTSCGGKKGTAQGAFDLTTDVNSHVGGISTPNPADIQKQLNEQVEKGMINISMNLNPVFQTGQSEGNLLIVNEQVNRYPQVVEIYLRDTDTLIYKSGGIDVGSSVEYAKLLVDLDAGNYECTAYFNAVDPDTGLLVGKAGAEIVVTVLE